MRFNVASKIIASYLLVTTITSGCVYLFAYVSAEQRAKEIGLQMGLLRFHEEVYTWYNKTGSWDGIAAFLHRNSPRIKIKNNQNNQNNASSYVSVEFFPPRHAILNTQGRLVTPFLEFDIGETLPDAYKTDLKAIEIADEKVGWIVPNKNIPVNHVQQLDQARTQIFINTFNKFMFISFLIGLCISLVAGFALSKVFLAPIKSLTRASNAISHGKLRQNLTVQSHDEIGKLTYTFNKMSHDLTIADQKRKQLTADIAHDLGTPIQIVSGYIEMALDGSLPLTDNTVKVIHAEIARMKLLLKDLNLLAETDTKSLSLQIAPLAITDLFAVIENLYTTACSKHEINLQIHSAPDLPLIELDRERMLQVFGNLITNSIRYTPVSGYIKLNAQWIDQHIVLTVEDSGQGIEEQDLPFIFDRFYRANNARLINSSKTINSGLGLTISKALIEMQGGSITVHSYGINRGCIFTIRFPVAAD